MFKQKQILRIPGPTPIPPSVQQAMNRPVVGHRSREFSDLLVRTAERLKPFFGTRQDVYIIAGSGTSAMEMSVVNTLQPGDEAIVVVNGVFSERFAKICERYGIVVHRCAVEWGQGIDPDSLSRFLQEHSKAKAVFAAYCETSTSALNPVAEMARVIREESDALFIVDGISCLGAVPCEMDAWGIDILITGSQKAFMLPTGLAFIAVSDRAWTVIDRNPQPSFYLDLRQYRKSFGQNTTPFTPAVTLVYGLEEALNLMEEEGLERIFARHELMKAMTRAAMRALEIPLMAPDAYASPTVTALDPKGAFDAEQLRKILRSKHNVEVAGGQAHLKGKIFRIGHMGYCEPLDVVTVVAAVEMALAELGFGDGLGKGVRAAQEVYLQHA